MQLYNKLLFKPLKGIYLVLLLAVTVGPGCKKYLTIPLPVTQIAGSAAFANDGAAAAVLNNVYAGILNVTVVDGANSAGYLYGLYGDELQNYATGITNSLFYTDAVSSTYTGGLWTNLYKQMYSVNSAIEGVSGNDALVYKSQWLGEAYFLRAFMHFYLANIYGDVPIVISSDYTINNVSKRNAQADVYKQIITDLKQAQGLLVNAYHDGGGAVVTDRARPNKMAATALLARVYLYTGDYANAATQADSVIANTTYQMAPLANVFLKGSTEMIWGMAPLATSYTVKDASYYLVTNGLTPLATIGSSYAVALSNTQVKAFETGDARFTNWVGVSNVPASGTVAAANYYYANKYKIKTTQTAPVEYAMVLRLAEQYLIRAEARVQLGNLIGANSAKSDLDIVRARASLVGTTATTKADILTAIMHERQVELFTEAGHRFFDLRRTGNLDAVMNVVAPMKSGVWSTYKQWWPIPSTDILTNPNLVQTPGYQ